MHREMMVAALLIATGGVQTQAQTQPSPPTGQLVISGQTGMSESPVRSGGVEWLHTPARSPVTLDVGAFTGAATDGWFSYGRFGGLLRRGASVIGASVDAGAGKQGSRSFGYTRVRALATVPLRGSEVQADGDIDHVRIADNVVTGVRVGMVIQTSARMAARVSAHVYAAGGEVDPGASIRADYDLGRVRVIGGLFASRRSLQAAPLVDVTPVLYATRTWFGGVDVGGGGPRVTVVIDVSRQARGHVTTVLAGVKLPLR